MPNIHVHRDEQGKITAEVEPPITEAEVFEAKEKMSQSRLRILINHPYFSRMVLAMGQRYVDNDRIETMAVDKYGRMYINARWANKLTDGQRDGVYLHEAMHLLLDHAQRAIAWNADPKVWNYAGDFAINSILKEAGIDLGEDALMPELAGLPPLKSTEEYYDLIMQKLEEQQQQGEGDGDGEGQQQQGGGKGKGKNKDKGQGLKERLDQQSSNANPQGNDGSGATGREAPWEEPGEGQGKDGMSQQEQQELREAVAQAMRNHAKQRGTMPAGWERWIDEVLGPPRVRWEKSLFRVVARCLTEIRGRTHITWTKPSRRRIPGFMLPAKRSFVEEIFLGVDNSGSMGGIERDSPLGKALAEAQGLIDQMALPGVWYGAIDASPEFEVTRTKNILKEKLVGGGGTDMRLAWQKAEELGVNLMVLFTDGDTPWPDEPPPGMHSIIVLTDGPRERVPEWAHVIVVEQ